MNAIQFVQCTPEDFQSALSKAVRAELEKFLAHYKPKQPNDHLTRAEVSAMFDIDMSTVHNWCKTGRLKPLGIGKRVYFLRSDVEQSLVPLKSSATERKALILKILRFEETNSEYRKHVENRLREFTYRRWSNDSQTRTNAVKKSQKL